MRRFFVLAGEMDSPPPSTPTIIASQEEDLLCHVCLWIISVKLDKKQTLPNVWVDGCWISKYHVSVFRAAGWNKCKGFWWSDREVVMMDGWMRHGSWLARWTAFNNRLGLWMWAPHSADSQNPSRTSFFSVPAIHTSIVMQWTVTPTQPCVTSPAFWCAVFYVSPQVLICFVKHLSSFLC